MRRLALLAGCTIGLVLALQDAPHGIAASRARLAYSHAGRIWLLSADGSHRRAVTRGVSPAWSPDGSLIAFVRASKDRFAVWVAAPDGSGARALVSDLSASYTEPAWSPDGTQLAVGRFEYSRSSIASAIEVVKRDGTGRRTVARLESRESLDTIGSPVWMPGGQRIAYTRVTAAQDAYRYDIHSVAVGGGDDRLFMAGAADGAWSPDGRRFAYSDVRDKHGTTCGSDECFPNGELAVADADGTNRRLLTHTIAEESGAAWSADGTRIAFASGRNTPELNFGQPELYSIGPDGSCLTWLTNGTPGSGEPTWSPAGGDASPARCGAAGRRPRVEVKPRRGTRGGLWVGPRLGSGLLAGSQSSPGEVLFDYTDCGVFRPSRCTPLFLLVEQRSCGSGRELAFVVPRLDRLRSVRGALVGYQRRDGRGVILVGRRWIHVQVESRASKSRELRLFAQIAHALRPVGGRRRSRQARPVLPAKVRKQLPARFRKLTRACG